MRKEQEKECGERIKIDKTEEKIRGKCEISHGEGKLGLEANKKDLKERKEHKCRVARM